MISSIFFSYLGGSRTDQLYKDLMGKIRLLTLEIQFGTEDLAREFANPNPPSAAEAQEAMFPLATSLEEIAMFLEL